MQPRARVLIGSVVLFGGAFALDWRFGVLVLGLLLVFSGIAAAAAGSGGSAQNPNRPPPGPPPAVRTRPAPKPSGHPSPWSPPEPTERTGDPLARRGQRPFGGGCVQEPVPDAKGPDEAPTARV